MPWQRKMCIRDSAYNAAVDFKYTGIYKAVVPAGAHEHYSIRTTPEAFCEKADRFSHIRLRLRSPEKKSAVRIAFLTDTGKRWAGDKCTCLLYTSRCV